MDIDKNKDISQRLKVEHVPTLLFFKNKKLIDKQVGISGHFAQNVENKIKTYI